jgi:hypothetical protein
MPRWFLKHEILQVRLRAQNDTLFVSQHSESHGLHVSALTLERPRPIVLDRRRVGVLPLISVATASLL